MQEQFLMKYYNDDEFKQYLSMDGHIEYMPVLNKRDEENFTVDEETAIEGLKLATITPEPEAKATATQDDAFASNF